MKKFPRDSEINSFNYAIPALITMIFAFCLAPNATAFPGASQQPFSKQEVPNNSNLDLLDGSSMHPDMAYGMALSRCSAKCGDENRGCIHVCCHDQCNVLIKPGDSGYWDCHRRCEEWRDPGSKETFPLNPSNSTK